MNKYRLINIIFLIIKDFYRITIHIYSLSACENIYFDGILGKMVIINNEA